jgi:hypothetical protein
VNLPLSEIVREFCEVTETLRRCALHELNLGPSQGHRVQLGKAAHRAWELQCRILGEPWIGVGKDEAGNWVLIDGRGQHEADR